MNSNVRSDDDRPYIFTTTMPLINSKSDVRRLIPETRQHNRKKIPKKLKVMMIDKVIMTAENEEERFCSFI